MRPIIKAALTSGSLMASGDILSQLIRNRGSSGFETHVNLKEVSHFALVGATLHGPYFYSCISRLDKLFGAGSHLTNAMKKAVATQLFISPIYICSFFLYMGLLDRHSLEDSLERVFNGAPKTIISTLPFTFPANLAGFWIIPPSQRMLFGNGVGVLFCSYLSLMNKSSKPSPTSEK